MNTTQKNIVKALVPLVRELTGQDAYVIPADDCPKAKEKNPEAYKEYLKLRREFNGVWKLALQEMPEETCTMDALLDSLRIRSIDHTLPLGFKGSIDKTGKWYIEHEGELKVIDGVPSAVVFPTVRMNPDFPNSPWVFQAIKADGTGGNYFYTRAFRKHRRTEKFSKVQDLLDTIDGIREQWIEMITHFDITEPKCVAAVILELLYQFSARVGSEGNSTKEGTLTYGLSTLRKKHCHVYEDRVVFSYLGKDGVKTRHVLTLETELEHKIAKICKVMATDEKAPRDPLFTYLTKGGKYKPVRSYVVNELFRELGAEGCTVHKLRTYHATKLALELIEDLKGKRKRFNSQRDAKDALTKIAEKVGKRLNHVRRTKEGKQKITGSTALANYIDVVAQVDFYNHYGIDIPPQLAKMVHA